MGPGGVEGRQEMVQRRAVSHQEIKGKSFDLLPSFIRDGCIFCLYSAPSMNPLVSNPHLHLMENLNGQTFKKNHLYNICGLVDILNFKFGSKRRSRSFSFLSLSSVYLQAALVKFTRQENQ